MTPFAPVPRASWQSSDSSEEGTHGRYRRLFPGLAIGLVVALAAHVCLGWAWASAGGIVAGVLLPERGWLAGLAVVGSAWIILIVYNLLVATEAVVEMFRVVGLAMAGSPVWLVPIVSLAIGGVIGTISGYLGAGLRRAVISRARSKPPHVESVHP